MDESLSPEKILYRLEELRKWQKIQEDRLLQQQLLQRKQLEDEQRKFYETIYSSQNDTSQIIADSSSCRISNSSFFDNDSKCGEAKRKEFSELSAMVEGVSVLNISEESEPRHSPVLSSAVPSVRSETSFDNHENTRSLTQKPVESKSIKTLPKLQIKIDEMPIIPAAKDFNALLEVKMKNDDAGILTTNKNKKVERNEKDVAKKPKAYLKRGQGLTRFNMTPNDIGLTKNKTLPWAKRRMPSNKNKEILKSPQSQNCNKDIIHNKVSENVEPQNSAKSKKKLDYQSSLENETQSSAHNTPEKYFDKESERVDELPKTKRTWASVLNEDQENYIRLLGEAAIKFNQHDFFDRSSLTSPSLDSLRANKEMAEQKMFDLLEKKVDNSSFCSNSSFIKKVIGCQGTDTPTTNMEFVKTFPHVLNLKPDIKTIENLNSTNDSVSEKPCNENIEQVVSESSDSENRISEETDDSSDSTDTEPTCKIALNKGVLTSTPIQVNNSKESKKRVFNVRTSSQDDKKVIKIVIQQDSTIASKMLDTETKSFTEDTTLTHKDELMREDLSSKAELLKTRLEELQKEIDIFKKENEIVAELKNNLETEKENFLQEKAENERKFNEDKIVSEYYLAEEKEKLAKQKLLYDRHVKEMKGQSLKKDKEEITNLKTELSLLKDQIKTKDAKVGASQARLRNQIKNLEKENDELKMECEKLQKENTRLRNANIRSRRISDIKSLAEINRSLGQSMLSNKSNQFEIEDVYPQKRISKEYFEDDNQKGVKSHTKPKVIKHGKPVRSKSVPNLSVKSHYAKYFSKRDEEDRQSFREQLGYGLYFDSDKNSDTSDSEPDILPSHFEKKKSSSSLGSSELKSVKDKKFGSFSDKSAINFRSSATERSLREPSDVGVHSCTVEKEYSKKFSNMDEDVEMTSVTDTNFNDKCNIFSKPHTKELSEILDHVVIDKQDGSKEIRFNNGNIKIISADRSYSKFLYYNGDIKETFYNEGTIKYYYKEVDTHHTTYKDGSQVLQFPDGQIERRYPDGSVESQLSDGVTRWARLGGTQEWKFPDGTLLVMTPQGDKTFRFPNGQVEVHTKDHKRREFPDGTVKVVYADGVVETRYANGRIRVKDKQDKLLLDSAGTTNTQRLL